MARHNAALLAMGVEDDLPSDDLASDGKPAWRVRVRRQNHIRKRSGP